MGRFDARITKLETSVGHADEARYCQAFADLQPAIADLYKRCGRDDWDYFFAEHARLHATLPPRPARLEVPGGTERLRAELAQRLDETRQRLEANAEILLALQARRGKL